MKRLNYLIALIALSGLTFTSGTAQASPLSACQAEAIAAKQVPVPSQDKLIQIFGARSTTSTSPTVWRFLFWDPMAEQNGRAVTVSDGAITEIRDGYVELDKLRLAAYKLEETIAPSDLRYDSNQALDKVVKDSGLKNVTLSSVEFLLIKDKGPVQPVWNLTLFAAKAGKEVQIGTARISASTGELFELKVDLKGLE